MGGRLSRASAGVTHSHWHFVGSHVARDEHATRTHERRPAIKVKRTHQHGSTTTDGGSIAANNDDTKTRQRTHTDTHDTRHTTHDTHTHTTHDTHTQTRHNIRNYVHQTKKQEIDKRKKRNILYGWIEERGEKHKKNSFKFFIFI